MTHEGALIAFTLLGQLVAGSIVIYSVVHFTRSEEGSSFPSGLRLKTPELLLMILLLGAIFISFFHLGNARQAVRALNNLGSSWISREILSLALLSLSLFLLFLGRWMIPERKRILNVLFLFSLFSGAALIYVMIRLYMIPAVVTWNSWYTPASFILTSFLLGICSVLFYVVAFPMELHSIRALNSLLIPFLLSEALITVVNQFRLDQLSVIHYNQLLLENTHLKLTIIRIGLIVFAIAILAIAQPSTTRRKLSTQEIWTGMAVLLILVEQIAGRWLFFASYVRVGI